MRLGTADGGGVEIEGRVAHAPAPGPGFRDVETWIFDLDNTLYPAHSNLFGQIDVRMGAFIAELLGIDPAAARRIQKDFYHRYGTTLKGLMIEHGIDPRRFLEHVHDIDVSVLAPVPGLAALLEHLPGRKLVFTNGSEAHALRVTERLGIAHVFDAVFDIVAAEYEPKPLEATYRRLVEREGVRPERAAMFEDLARNLLPAHALGMITVWVHSDTEHHRESHAPGSIFHAADHDHIHHMTDDLPGFVRDVFASLWRHTHGV